MRIQSFFMLLLIVSVGIFFRFYNVNWDQNFHLHPDERFLTLVGIKESFPTTISQYFNPLSSPLNPNVIGFTFFVYGVFPLTLNFLLSLITHYQTYDLFVLQGRVLSASFDIGSILLVYLVMSLLEKPFGFDKKAKLFAAFFYAIAVLPIQLSHFFTVDIFLSFFMLLSLYFCLRFTLYKNLWILIFSGISLGLAIACKINGLAIIPLDLILLILPFVGEKTLWKTLFLALTIFLLCAYLSLRFFDPYLFSTANFLNPQINENFLKSITSLAYYANPHVWYPPNVQWTNKLPIIFSLFNIAFFGLGIGIFLFTCIGVYYCLKTRKILLVSIALWVILFFLYQSVQYVKTMRYFIFLYPFFTLFAGIGFAEFIKGKSKITILVSSFLIVIWPISFLSIYTKSHTRITASDWIVSHIPSRSIILGEYWDDSLPLVNDDTRYSIDLLHVFDPDTEQKWKSIDNQLKNADYLVLSSNRGWGSIPADPKSYPRMSAWYKNLLSGKLPYKKIAEFSSYPSLNYIGIPITFADNISEEAFTVYDHPVVMIFKNQIPK